ncbi:MAG: hypothetical protein WA151_11365 [Desulfatirhabdiaceae bacterium]
MQKEVKKKSWSQYRGDGNKCIKFAEDNVWISVYPPGKEMSALVPIGAAKWSKDVMCPGVDMSYHDIWTMPHHGTGRSYQTMWEEQKKILREALAVGDDGTFRYCLIVFCWPRGDGKSFNAVLIQLWRFCCWPNMDIRFCANSKDQTGHAHYTELKKMVLNSPNLLAYIGEKNVQEKGIRLKDKRGVVKSKMEIISTASGLFSNIDGYAFSEFFEMKNEDFFAKLDMSMRNKPNALGIIDTTVSSKTHPLYRLYKAFIEKADTKLYFSYRSSTTGHFTDYIHPRNSAAQLASYKVKHALNFGRFFLNLWSSGSERVFSEEQVEGINYIGADAQVLNHHRVIELIQEKHKIIDSDKELVEGGLTDVYSRERQIGDIDEHLWPIEDVYRFSGTSTGNGMITPRETLDVLGEMFDTEWAVLVGVDRAQPMKIRTNARTIVTTTIKGLPGSRSNPNIGVINKKADPGVYRARPEAYIDGPKYVYFLVHVAHIADHSMAGMKAEITIVSEEFDGIDTIGSEHWGMFDFKEWTVDIMPDTKVILWQPTKDKQMGMFTAFHELMVGGRWKTPQTGISGSKGGDIAIEELGMFDHDPERTWFGSPEKDAKYGVQDDFVYSVCAGIYGGRTLTVENFRPRLGKQFWGTMLLPGGLIGDYRDDRLQ